LPPTLAQSFGEETQPAGIPDPSVLPNIKGTNMLRDLALAAKAACSREDQESLIPMVKQLRDLGETAFKKGLLALEGELMQIKDPFLKLGIQLIVDKTEPENVQDILDADIYYNESNGRELLKKIIIREGLLRIQAGDNARNILICTKVFLGKVDASLW
jgi:chemotaxis protein MotA